MTTTKCVYTKFGNQTLRSFSEKNARFLKKNAEMKKCRDADWERLLWQPAAIAPGQRRVSWITDLLTLTSTSSLPQTAINLRFDPICTGVDIGFIVFGQVTTPITPEFVTLWFVSTQGQLYLEQCHIRCTGGHTEWLDQTPCGTLTGTTNSGISYFCVLSFKGTHCPTSHYPTKTIMKSHFLSLRVCVWGGVAIHGGRFLQPS